MFVQIIRFRTRRYAEVEKLIKDNDPRLDPSGPGPNQTHILHSRKDPDAYVALAYFDSAGQAQENSTRPETGQWYQQFTQLVDGEVEFVDTDLIYERDRTIPTSVS